MPAMSDDACTRAVSDFKGFLQPTRALARALQRWIVKKLTHHALPHILSDCQEAVLSRTAPHPPHSRSTLTCIRHDELASPTHNNGAHLARQSIGINDTQRPPTTHNPRRHLQTPHRCSQFEENRSTSMELMVPCQRLSTLASKRG